MGHHKEKCCKSKCKKSKKCDSKKKCDCKPLRCQCEPTPEPDCLNDCCRMSLTNPVVLSGISTQLVAQNNGDASSPARILYIEAEVSPIATVLVPASSVFEIRIDGNPVFPTIRVDTNVIGAPVPNETRSSVLKASVQVTAGAHTVALFGTSILQTNEVRAASLTVCDKIV